MKIKSFLIILLTLLLLSSCTSIKNEIIRSKLSVSREELKELKKTSDPNVTLSDGSALMVYAMNKYANEDGSFNSTEDISLLEDRKITSVSLSSSTLWVSYPKEYKEGDVLPVIFFTHGGGYTQSSYKTYQKLLAILSDRTSSIVFAVDYSLAPEYKFPKAVEDVWEAYTYLLDNAASYNADTSKIILLGDSAGGNFAAGLSIRAKEENVTEPVGVVLIYPNLCVYPVLLPSHVLFGGFDGRKTMISLKVMEHTYTSYLETMEDGLKPYASPLLMLEGALNTLSVPNLYEECAVETDEDGKYILPEHLIIVAEADSLRDEGIMYHALLTDLGSTSTLSVYKGAIHAFFQLYEILDDGEKAIKEISSFIERKVAE